MKYSEVEQYINNIPKFTKKNSMDHTKRFMELLEITDKKMKIIHVAGTNGKGSTCAYMNAILCQEGKSVGMFTSPHLEKMTERIRINGKNLPEDEFRRAFHKVMEVVEVMKAEELPHPTFFEFLLGMAMVSFDKNHMEYVILETGLGGRLDATNVFEKPIVTVITSIGLDHELYLGDTIEKIAREKAGIIKDNVPLIYDGSREAVSQVMEEVARNHGSKCKKISDSAYEIIEKTEKDIAFYFKDEYDKNVIWKIWNKGSYQVTNAALAITALRTIFLEEEIHQEIHQEIHLENWQRALRDVSWPGRMEELEPGIWIDGAHNISAIEAITKEFTKLDVVLFSAVQDKNYEKMIESFTKNVEVKAYIVTKIDSDRGVEAEALGALFEEYSDVPVYVEEDIAEAWKQLQKLKSPEGKALCLGSLYLVGMVKEFYRNREVKE